MKIHDECGTKSISLLFLGIVMLAGCATATTGLPTGFLPDYSRLETGKYFLQEYAVEGADFTRYDSVKVAPVNFGYLINKTSCKAGDLEDLGRAFREDMEKEFTAKGYRIASVPTEKTLIVEAAVTDIELPEVLVNAAMNLSPVPVGMLLDTNGATAFEAKILDGATGRVLMEIAEKQKGSGSNLDVGALAVGGYINFVNAKAVFRGWAKNMALMLTQGKAVK